MNHQVLTSFITLGISITSVGLLSKMRHFLQHSRVVTHLDQTVRAIMLAFAVYHIGYELLETFTVRDLMICTLGFYFIQHAVIRLSNQFTHTKYLHEHYPWLIYMLLVPHFITEGFMIAPQAGKNSLSIVIAGFLLHKTFEVAMLTMSTNHQIHCQSQRRMLQTLFVILTPLAIVLHTPFKQFIQVNHTLHGYTEFLNFIVFIQLSMFCQFCTHEHDKPASWLRSNRSFMLAFGLISVAVFFYPELLI